MQNEKTFWGQLSTVGLPALLLGLAIIISTGIGASTAYSIKALDNSLSVTGSASQKITSDQAKWSGSWTRVVAESDLKYGYDEMAADMAAVKAFLAKNNVAEGTYTISNVSMDQVYKQNDQGPREYNLRQSLEVRSDNVQAITDLSKRSGDLAAQGVLFSGYAPEYSYSKLADLRVSLLSAALKDARARAEAIVSQAGRHVGDIKSAASGVVQVLAPNSVDVSDYGSYDTASIDKQVMVTVKAAFSIK